MNEQTEIPDVPPVGRLKKLRTALPLADGIIRQAKEVSAALPHVDLQAEAKAVAQRRRAIATLMGSLGIPHKAVRSTEDFPSGTRRAASASKDFRVALESAMSVIAAVRAAEQAAIPGLRS